MTALSICSGVLFFVVALICELMAVALAHGHLPFGYRHIADNVDTDNMKETCQKMGHATWPLVAGASALAALHGVGCVCMLLIPSTQSPPLPLHVLVPLGIIVVGCLLYLSRRAALSTIQHIVCSGEHAPSDEEMDKR